jgi:nitrite reductase (NO-forming)
MENLMKKTFSNRLVRFVTFLILSAVVATACAAAPAANSTHTPPAAGADAAAPAAAATELVRGSQPGLGDPAASFTLRTDLADGRMVFIGVGGELDGVVNPDLHVQPGDVVEIRLVNGDGALHDWGVPQMGAVTDQIAGQNSETVLEFKAGQAGVYDYYCTVPGHRQAGMVGRLIVGDVAQAAEVTTSVVRNPADLPPALNRSQPANVRVDLETIEVQARLADGSSYTYWTFNGKVPGPFIRVRVGDTVEVHLKNAADSMMNHSVDFHATTGPGGGAVATQTMPGGETQFTFKAMNPGLYVYHCATPMVAHHITNGMYGLILVEPEGGLPPVDREFYVMQGELYTAEEMGTQGENTFSVEKLLDEQPEYFFFNGALGGLTAEAPLKANVGETVRIFFGVGGPNFTSSFHVIGEIFDRVFDQGSLTAPPLTDVQTTLVPPGGSTMVEFKLEVPGRYILVDHALSRAERGLAGYLLVEGPQDNAIYDGPLSGGGH